MRGMRDKPRDATTPVEMSCPLVAISRNIVFTQFLDFGESGWTLLKR
jgi:hypothetical protein